MIAPPAALRRVGWAALIAICCAMLFGLSLKVNALKSEVRLAERRLIALKRETMYLETEYETRSNQQQLAAWNAVDFGYAAPGPGQYLESERQLATLGKALGTGAPPPIRVASAPPQTSGFLPTLVSPLTGRPLGDEVAPLSDAVAVDHDKAAASLADRLVKPEIGDRAPDAEKADPAGGKP